MRKSTRILAVIVLLLGFLALSQSMIAQNVVRKGNKFEVVKDTAQQTDLLFVDKDGKVYNIYLSSKGKAFIICKSKKTGNEYKRYLPKVTEEIQKDKKYGKYSK